MVNIFELLLSWSGLGDQLMNSDRSHDYVEIIELERKGSEPLAREKKNSRECLENKDSYNQSEEGNVLQ